MSFHSSATIVEQVPLGTLARVLCSWENPSLWNQLSYDGDGSWIRAGLERSSIVTISDGSYQREVDPLAYSAAFTVKCVLTGFCAQGTWVERCLSASNYRGKLLSALGAILLIKAVLHGYTDQPLPTTEFYCDNMGRIFHTIQPHCPLHEKQKQSDLLSLILHLLRELDMVCEIKCHHIDGHLDKILHFNQLNPIQQENVLQDSLTKEALTRGV